MYYETYNKAAKHGWKFWSVRLIGNTTYTILYLPAGGMAGVGQRFCRKIAIHPTTGRLFSVERADKNHLGV